MNDVSCPFCSTKQTLPQAPGETARCRSCGKTFMVPATKDASQSPAAGRAAVPRTFPTPQASAGISPASPPVPAPVAPLFPPARAPHHASPANSPRNPPATSVPLPVSAPISTATPNPRESVENTRPAEPPSTLSALMILAGFVCFLLGGLILAVAVAVRVGKRPTQLDLPVTLAADAPPSEQIVRWTPESSRRSGWSRVSRGIAIDINALTVDVHFVDFGEVRARDAENRVIVTEQKNYLQVHLKIKNRGVGAVEYTSWQGNAFPSPDGLVRATLVDDQLRSYPMQDFANVAGFKGHTPRAVLENQDEIGDVVVFTIPESIDRRVIRHFRLELPAEAYGGSGVYRFEIPRHSIQGF